MRLVPARWLARTSFLLMGAAVVVAVVPSAEHGLRLLLTVGLCVLVVLVAAYRLLAHRGWRRVAALAALVAAPVVAAVLLVDAGLVRELVAVVVLVGPAVAAGRAALAPEVTDSAMPEHAAPTPRHPFLVMNPRSGGGKVAQYGLKEKAEALGAEVVLLGDGEVDAAAVARDAVARGADLLGVAGGDGTQALVAGVAADQGVPFAVVSAGTRNHFALDLGLEREDPSACLDALTDDAVELHVDIGQVGGRSFVNNVSFGAYAELVRSPSYRTGKARTALDLLPDLLGGRVRHRWRVRVDGVPLDDPQVVLVSVNPYGVGDLAGVGRRARLDTGRLGVVAMRVDSARSALGLLRPARNRGLSFVGPAHEVVVDADSAEIPVGVDGEAVTVPTPVTCGIRPRALRVRVPRRRPGVRPPRPAWSWAGLWRLAVPSRRGGS